MATVRPVIMSFPFLPLRSPVACGAWRLCPLSQFDGRWASGEFETWGRRFLGSFHDVQGHPIGEPCIVTRVEGGATGVRPTSAEREALRAAVSFAVIDRNPLWERGWPESYRMRSWMTTDNADYWEQPIDCEQGLITLDRGKRVVSTTLGHRLDDDNFAIRISPETHIPFDPVPLDEQTVQAVYEFVFSEVPQTKPRPSATMVLRAISWIAKSWYNTTSMSDADRIVFLKIAAESITGNMHWHAGKEIGCLFGSVFAVPEVCEFWRDSSLRDEQSWPLLWTPTEPRRLRATQRHRQLLPDLEHWYAAFADARNAIVHEGTDEVPEYSEPDSRYAGPFVNIADRVLREAIKVAVSTGDYPDVWTGVGPWSAALGLLRKLKSQMDAGENVEA